MEKRCIMTNLTTAERRRWATDMRTYWADTRSADKAEAHANLMIAKADLDDAEADRETITADKAIVEYNIPILGRYTVSGAMERTYDCCYDNAMADYCESRGIFTAWEWRNDPTAEEHCGELVRLAYISAAESPGRKRNIMLVIGHGISSQAGAISAKNMLAAEIGDRKNAPAMMCRKSIQNYRRLLWITKGSSGQK